MEGRAGPGNASSAWPLHKYAFTMSLSEQQAAALSAETVVVAAGRPPRERDQPVNHPVVLSSTYFGTGALGDGDRGYGRYSIPPGIPSKRPSASLKGPIFPGFSTHRDLRRSAQPFP